MFIAKSFTFSVTDRDFLELHGIFGSQLLEESLDLIDREKLTIYKCESREYIEIVDHQNLIFKLLPNINYCMCPTFRDQVIRTHESYTCKHVLAAKLALLLGKIKVESVKDDALTFALQMIKPMTTFPADD